MRVRELTTHRVTTEKLALTGAEPSGATVLITDAAGDALYVTGTTVPSDTASGYAKGCLFIDTDVATGTSGLYTNVGVRTSCVFKLVTNA